MATKYCTDFLEWEKKKEQHINRLDFKLLAEKIAKATKFQLPDNGKILEIKKKAGGNAYHTYKDYIPIFKLPYDLMVMELNILDTGGNPAPCIILLEQHGDRIKFYTLLRVDAKGFWASMTDLPVMIIPDVENESINIGYPSVVIEDDQSGKEVTMHLIDQSIEILLGFLAALCCSNADSTVEIKADEKLNKSRMKKGKAPYFTYKVLTINTQQDRVTTTGAEQKGKHASPRIHLRRGHIRRLKEKTVWVNACTVGNKLLGEVGKSYKVI